MTEKRSPSRRAVFRKRPVDARLAVLVRGCEEDQRRVVDVRSEDWVSGMIGSIGYIGMIGTIL